MTPNDWQEFDDQSLTPEETQRCEQILSSDPTAKQELDGLREFRATVKEKALREEAVPQARLEGMLTDVVHQPRKSSNRWLLFTPLAAAAALALFIAINNFAHPKQESIKFDTTPVMARMESSDPYAGSAWLMAQTHTGAPTIKLGRLPQAQYCGSMYGSGWMAYEFRYKGKEYTIYCKKSSTDLDKLKEQIDQMKTFYTDANSVGWYCVGQMCYIVQGGDQEGRWQIARHASLDTPSLAKNL